jgi:uncharacterized protein (TIGR02246 family)
MRSTISLSILAVVVCVAVVPIAAQGDDTQAIARLEAEWNAAHTRGDGAALAQLFADDMVVVVPGMRPMGKDDSLSVFKTGGMRFDRYETSDTTTRVYADSAVVSGRLRRGRKMGERVVDDDWRFTKVYVRRAGKWQVVSFHASAIEPQ